MQKALAAMIDRLSGTGIGATLYRGASVFLVISVVGTGIAFLLHVLLARLLGPESYGHYAYATNMVAILTIGSHLGYQHASVRFVSQYNSAGDWGRLQGFYRASARSMLLGSAATSGLILLGVTAAYQVFGIDAERTGSLLVVALVVPATAFSAVWSGRLRGLKAVSQSQVPTAIVQPICVVACILALVSLRNEPLGAATALLALAGSVLVSFAISEFFLRKRATAEQRQADPIYEREEWRRVANSFLLVTIAQIVRNRFIIVILAFHQAAAEIGFYSAAKQIAGLAIFGLAAVAAWAAPMIAEYHAAGEQERLQRLAKVAARFTIAFSLAATSIVVIFGQEILGLFGPDFRGVYVPLLIIAAGQFVNSVTGPVGYLLTMTGNQALSARIEASTAVVAIAMCLVLVPSHGLIGAALADASANVLRNAVLFVAVWKRVGVRSAIF